MARNTAAVRVNELSLGHTSNPQWLDRRTATVDSGGKVKHMVKVTRYWPGKAPDWAPEEEEDLEEEEDEEKEVQGGAPVAMLNRKDDPRLRRLAERKASRKDKGDEGDEDEEDEREVRHSRTVRKAEVVSESDEEADDGMQQDKIIAGKEDSSEEEEEEEEEEDMIELRRMQMKRRMMEQRARVEEDALA
eukprot:CAMPEP_0196571812 /NCGR_PEP_ID=MMETSP1081-20130531/1956_1 /TAXON_ID=36882 /ORGANISM="Pyramimonas amylifera, Strain CCMP720" /LENGTH=189 /DNA_ID=CAMNT_0041888907 /DNA_START=195 /DNA_END=760 /DNA_ORIENTATION=-